jgi:putative membrane protein
LKKSNGTNQQIMKKVSDLLKNSAFLFSAVFIMAGCNSQKESKTETMPMDSPQVVTPPAAETAPAATEAALTDPEIASIAVTANQIDVDYAKIAKAKSKTKSVLDFAATMSKDHQSVIDKAVALVKKLGVTPQDNPTTQSLLSGASETKTMLNSKTGAEFDKAYVDNEVAYHKAAIDIVENKLIPSSSNAELKALLQSALPLFKEHLSHAEMVQKELNK